MKKLFLAATLILLASSLKAQEMNFEQTVKYIQEKVIEYEDKRLVESGEFNATPNGEIKLTEYKFNLFILNNKNKKEYQNQNEFGIGLRHQSLDDGNTLVPGIEFYSDGSSVASIAFRYTIPLIEMERIRKAIIHLRSLCTKEKDPFDN